MNSFQSFLLDSACAAITWSATRTPMMGELTTGTVGLYKLTYETQAETAWK
jgi:hypothetical protein